MEYRLLAELSANAGRLLTYEHLLERVLGEKSSGDVRPMRTIVSKLRRKLGDDADNPIYIFTGPRVGYGMPKGGGAGRRVARNCLSRQDPNTLLGRRRRCRSPTQPWLPAPSVSPSDTSPAAWWTNAPV